MRAFILLGLTVSNALAALNSNGESIKLAGLQKRNLGAASPDQLFGRQAGTCPFGDIACSDGLSCCPVLTTCCLDGCCQASYVCDPTGDGNALQPCVCYGIGCPDPQNGGFSTTFSRPFPSATTEPTTAVAVPTNTEAGGDTVTVTSAPTAATTDSSADSSVNDTSASGPIATVTVGGGSSSDSSSGGGSSGGSNVSAGDKHSSMGALAVMLLAGSVGIAAFAL